MTAMPHPALAPSGLDLSLVARRVRDLPALPAALNEVLSALHNEAMRTDRFAQLIEADQALCGRTLRLANSAFYGMQGRVGSVHDALRLLGLRTVATMLTAASVCRYADLGLCHGFDGRSFWRHAIAVSIAAREIASARGHDAGLACVTGLLHDVGKLALATHFPAHLSAALDLARSADCAPLSAERSVLGLDHAQVGTMVARHWGLPLGMALAIRQHHEPPVGAGVDHDATTWLTDTVHLADAIAHALDVAQAANEAVPAVSLDSWERLGMGRLDCGHIFARIEEGVESMASALDL